MKVTFNLSRDCTMLFHGSIEEKHCGELSEDGCSGWVDEYASFLLLTGSSYWVTEQTFMSGQMTDTVIK